MCVVLVACSAVTIPGAEFQALQDLYNSANGAHWSWHRKSPPTSQRSTASDTLTASVVYKHWNFSDPNVNPCTQNWYGIACLPYSAPAPYYHISQLLLSSYKLNGTIPCTIAKLSQLAILDFSRNLLHGTIPPSICTLSALSGLYLRDNQLSGPIPTTVDRLYRLTNLQMQDNRLTGSIPPQISNCTTLTTLNAASNSLTGRLPNDLNALLNLHTLDAHDNFLTGTLPAEIGKLKQLQSLALNSNDLSGGIPTSFDEITTLQHLQLEFNRLTGTEPAFICNNPQLLEVKMQFNHLHGGLPDCFDTTPELQRLYLYNNSLTGTLPGSLCTLGGFRELLLQDNRIHGTIPGCYCDVSFLSDLNLGNNRLTGTLPALYGATYSGHLEQLLVQNNRLTGCLEGVFNISTVGSLSVVVLGDNLFTGTIPSVLFDLPIVETLILSGNCFHGTLPSNVCGSYALQILGMNGLSSGSACRTPVLPGVSSAYTVSRAVTGTLPACLFEMFSLMSLQLSGNGFTGTLPEYTVPYCDPSIGCDDDYLASASANGTVLPLRISPLLIALSLSHNQLSGRIPTAVQEHAWHVLDLSFNKFTGTLSPALAANQVNLTDSYIAAVQLEAVGLVNNTVLSLENNRLSGRIPACVHGLADVSVLGTNMFACKTDESDLPAHDPGDSNYQCASNNFDTPYYVWLGLATATLLLILCVLLYAALVPESSAVNRVRTLVCKWYAQPNALPQHPSIARFTALVRALSVVSGCCVLYIVVVLLPLYGGLSAHYSMCTYSYAWTISAGFLSGRAACAALFVALVFLLGWFVACSRRILLSAGSEEPGTSTVSSNRDNHSGVKHDTQLASATTTPDERTLRSTQYALIFATFCAIHILVVGGVYVAYVYVAIYQSNTLLTVSQVLLSFFKIFWNNVAADKILFGTANGIVHWVNRLTGARPQPTLTLQRLNEVFEPMQFFVGLLNFIAIPCIVVLGVSPNCFYNAFVQAPSVTTTYPTQTCLDQDAECVTARHVSSYEPPFRYSYQCSASLITYYAPAFLNVCLVGMFLTPALELGRALLLRLVPKHWLVSDYIDEITPALLKPLPPNVVVTPPPQTLSPHGDEEHNLPTTSEAVSHSTNRIAQEAGSPTEKALFDPSRLLYSLLSNLALLLTFGAVFPPLGVALAATSAVTVWYARLKLGRFLAEATEQQQLHLVAKIAAECETVCGGHHLGSAVWALVTLSCWFHTLFLFDTLGDAVGFGGAYWVLIVMPLMPVVVYTLWTAIARSGHSLSSFLPATKSPAAAVEVKLGDIEMNPLGEVN
jgi:hypothetical protein